MRFQPTFRRLLLSVVGVGLFACASAETRSTQQPSPPPSATTKRVIDKDGPLAVASGVQVTAPAGFTVEQRADVAVFTAPEGDAAAAVVVLNAANIEAAVAQAWSTAKPDMKDAIENVERPPPKDGWEEIGVFHYTVPPDAGRVVQAVVRRKGTRNVVVLLWGTPAGLGRRGAQIGTIFSSVTVEGVAKETLAGRTAKVLGENELATLSAFIDQARTAMHVPGLAVALLQGETLWTHGYGVTAQGSTTAVTDNTLFMIGSTTKSLTTLLQAKAVDAHKLNWDDPATKFLPEFSLASPALTQQLLVRHTACACTGFPRRDLPFLFEFRGVTPTQRVQEMSTWTPTTGFGETFQYSNSLVAVAGYVAGRAYAPGVEMGKAYDDALAAEILKPLGMTSTTSDFDRAQKLGAARPHGASVDAPASPFAVDIERGVHAVRPAGALWSSVREMARYVSLELHQGMLPDGKRLLSEAALVERRKPGIKIIDDFHYGLGLFVDQRTGVTIIGHGGNNLGFTSDMWFVPEASLGFVVLANQAATNSLNSLIQRRILELVYGAEPRAEQQLAFVVNAANEARAKQLAALVDVDDALAARLVGTFRDDTLGVATVTRDGKTLVVDFGEFKSRAKKQTVAGTDMLVLLDAPFLSLPLLPLPEGRGFRLESGQESYRFVEAKRAK